jgi:molybdenum cofactor cytidylyltransferase
MHTPDENNDHRGTDVTAILLAAGRSRRMGRPKQLLPLRGEDTVIEVVASRLRPHVMELVVVVGHVGGQVAAMLADQDVILAINDNVDAGMLSSVQAGVRAADPRSRGYLICLGDQPSLQTPVIEAVLQGAAGGGGIVIPTYGGKRGHPVFIHRRYREEILALDPVTTGLNVLTRGHREDTVEIVLRDALILDDMDTPDDYAREFERAEMTN